MEAFRNYAPAPSADELARAIAIVGQRARAADYQLPQNGADATALEWLTTAANAAARTTSDGEAPDLQLAQLPKRVVSLKEPIMTMDEYRKLASIGR